MAEPRALLVVCTANLCRSPVAAALFARALDGVVDVDGQPWTVASAGTSQYDGPVEPDTVAAAADLGIDIRQHTPRRIDRDDVADADLVVTMTREHLRSVVADDPLAWSKTFTLRELARRAALAGRPNDGFATWRRDIASGRRTSDMLKPSPDDDVDDPYRRGRAANVAMVNELDRLITGVVRVGPWRSA